MSAKRKPSFAVVAQTILFTMRTEGAAPQGARGAHSSMLGSVGFVVAVSVVAAGILRAVCVPLEFRGAGSFALAFAPFYRRLEFLNR